MRLKSKNFTPPFMGWFFITKEGIEFFSHSYDELLLLVIEHYRQNDRFTEKEKGYNEFRSGKDLYIYSKLDLDTEIQTQICSRLQEDLCSGDNSDKVSLMDIIAGTKALIDLLVKKNYVSSSIAEDRAAICASCPNNVDRWGCWVCLPVAKLARNFLKRRTRFSHLLFACSICKCALELKVHCTDSLIRKLSEKYKGNYPTHCWINRILYE